MSLNYVLIIQRYNCSPFLTPYPWLWRVSRSLTASTPTATQSRAHDPLHKSVLSSSCCSLSLCQSCHLPCDPPLPSGLNQMVFFVLSFSTPSDQILSVLSSKDLLTSWPMCCLSCLLAFLRDFYNSQSTAWLHPSWVASVVSDSLQPQGLRPARLLYPWNSPGKNTAGVPCSPLGNLPNPRFKPMSSASPALQVYSLPLSHWGSPSIPMHRY